MRAFRSLSLIVATAAAGVRPFRPLPRSRRAPSKAAAVRLVPEAERHLRRMVLGLDARARPSPAGAKLQARNVAGRSGRGAEAWRQMDRAGKTPNPIFESQRRVNEPHAST